MFIVPFLTVQLDGDNNNGWRSIIVDGDGEQSLTIDSVDQWSTMIGGNRQWLIVTCNDG